MDVNAAKPRSRTFGATPIDARDCDPVQAIREADGRAWRGRLPRAIGAAHVEQDVEVSTHRRADAASPASAASALDAPYRDILNPQAEIIGVSTTRLGNSELCGTSWKGREICVR